MSHPQTSSSSTSFADEQASERAIAQMIANDVYDADHGTDRDTDRVISDLLSQDLKRQDEASYSFPSPNSYATSTNYAYRTAIPLLDINHPRPIQPYVPASSSSQSAAPPTSPLDSSSVQASSGSTTGATSPHGAFSSANSANAMVGIGPSNHHDDEIRSRRRRRDDYDDDASRHHGRRSRRSDGRGNGFWCTGGSTDATPHFIQHNRAEPVGRRELVEIQLRAIFQRMYGPEAANEVMRCTCESCGRLR